ncbi:MULTISPECIES: DUF2336 domain-containing protein [Hyphomicrobiales]|jgi:hypothetical protein|uniref:DUF2336 domain-containing protein n=1 Tax=Methylobacterium sp. CCH7-A2 TaxID=1768789 RepID=UPI00082DF667|nr:MULTISPECIES: DUF2336 domain-containing protein [Hyphomicrobiales]
MPSRISAEIAQLARLARDGGLDLSQVSLRVKADLLMSTPSPAPDDLAAFGEMAATLVPGIDEATAVILARKIAGWRHAPARAVAALRARGGAVLAALIQHGLPLGEAEIEGLAGSSDGRLPAALAERADLTATAVLILVERGERALDFALMGNTAIALPRAALDLLLARARLDAGYAQPLLARRDLSSAEIAPLFLSAGPERRQAILDSLAALEALSPTERRPAVSAEALAGWLATAPDDRAGAFEALARHLGGGPALASALEADVSRDLTALALTAAGASVEDATRFLIRLGDEAAHSVDRIFAVVALMRSVRPAIAQRLVAQIGGTAPVATLRKGQHQPAMDPSGTPARQSPARTEPAGSTSEILRKIGAKRDGA